MLKDKPANIRRLPIYQTEDFETLKNRYIRLYAYTNRFTTQILPYLPHKETIILLFSAEGILLKVYGDKAVRETLADTYGIMRMSDWRASSIGYCAISEGLGTQKPHSSIGDANAHPALKHFAIYFSPCVTEAESSDDTPVVIGGIGILTLVQYAEDSLLLTTAAAVNDVVLHLFMSGTLDMATDSEEGFLTMDFNAVTGRKSLIYHNKNIYRILEIPDMNLYFRRAEDIFDPRPKNQAFWDIIEKREAVRNRVLSISIMGNVRRFALTTSAYTEHSLNIFGINMYFRSRKSTALQLSHYIGNDASVTFRDLAGSSSIFLKTVRQAKNIAEANDDVLILGETGTGKDILAQCIHNASPRAGHPFVILNCAAYPNEMLYNLLLGNLQKDKDPTETLSYLELADDGTLLLNDVDELPLDIQSALVQYLDQRTMLEQHLLGFSLPDVKIIATSTVDLVDLVQQKKFRSDLYYHLNRLHLRIPPLRERTADLQPLTEQFLKNINESRANGNKVTISLKAQRLITQLPWNGNIRELKNTINGIVQINPSYTEIDPDDIIDYLSSSGTLPGEFSTYEHYIVPGTKQLTAQILRDALAANDGNKKLTAQKLGISRRSLYRYLEKFQMTDV